MMAALHAVVPPSRVHLAQPSYHRAASVAALAAAAAVAQQSRAEGSGSSGTTTLPGYASAHDRDAEWWGRGVQRALTAALHASAGGAAEPILVCGACVRACVRAPPACCRCVRVCVRARGVLRGGWQGPCFSWPRRGRRSESTSRGMTRRWRCWRACRRRRPACKCLRGTCSGVCPSCMCLSLERRL